MATGQSSYFDSDNNTTYYDLTKKTGDSAEINGALFFATAPATSSGTGLIQAFVRVQDGGGNDTSPGFENGYNTDFRPLSYEENTSPSFTTSLLLSSVPVVTIDGVQYYEFRLDINQLKSSPGLSLDEIKLYTSNVSDGLAQGEITGTWFNDNAHLVYDMDGNGDSSVLLDYSLQAGSGKSDMFFYVAKSDFGNVVPGDTYVTLYSEFGQAGTLDSADLTALDDPANTALNYNGSDANDSTAAMAGTYTSNDGFEEWSVSKQISGAYIGGYKFLDTNGNGTWDTGETGLGGWQIDYTITYETKQGNVTTVHTSTGTVTTSDGNTDVTGDGVADPVGAYAIPVESSPDNNETYTITLTEHPQEGWVNTYDGDATANYTTTFTFKENDLTTTGSPNISGASGQTEPMNFGNFELYDISGTKYEDVNGNGAVDAGDNGLAGWTIFIDANNNQTLDAGEKSAVTDANGNWSITGLDASFDGLPVLEVNQAGWVQTLGPVNTIVGTSGNDQTGFDFANFELYDISGTKYEDVNGNGAVDAGDNGLAGWTIFIDANNNQTLDAGEKSAVTDANGNWSITGLDASFDGLPVLEVNQAGWVQTLGPVNTIVGTSGNDQTGFDFANFELYDISGTKYEDVNGNGAVDAGDNGLAGWTIFIDANNNQTLDAGEKSAVTDANGNWSITGLDASFDGLPVLEVNQAGWVQTLGPVNTIVGTSGNDQTGFDFANFELYDISGTKYEDVNGNGAVDAGDNGLAGWTIFIDANNNQTLDAGEKSAVTDANGNWSITGLDASFDGLPVLEVNQAGWVQTLGPVNTIVGTSGNDQTGFDFANFELYDISGTKYEDVNGNGAVDAGDNGLAGWTIFIDANNNQTLDAGEKSAVTDANGNWSITGLDASFDGLPVLEVNQAGWVQTLGPVNTIVGTSGNDQTGFDFANFELYDISGTKYEDVNGNGAVDAGDNGLAGWTIFIDANNNQTLDAGEKSAVTDANGNWSITGLDASFDGLPVLEVNQAGWVQTLGPVNTIVGTSGNDQTGFDFANFELYDISGTKYEDVNGNGAVDAGDNGLAGWTIFIDANNNQTLDAGEKSAVTDANGNWSITGLDASFDGLPVLEVNQAGWVQTLGPVNTIVGTSGNDQTGFDFANFELYDISGTKYEDVNGNGAVDAGDNGLAGWTIFIDANNNQTLDAGEKSAVTDANGNWSITGLDASFDGLPVLEVNQAGWVQTLGPVNTIVGTSGNDQTGFDFANFELYDISGTKYEDVNGNGAVDAGDNGLAGWTIFIDANNNQTLDAGEKSAVTDANGNWSITGLDASFDGLPVLEVNQAGWVQTLGPVNTIVGTSGNDQTGFDFANFELYDISGTKYEDVNGNGAVDAGDNGLAGWTIFIDANNNQTLDAGEKSAVTDANGNWSITGLDASFDGLPVLEVNQAGWVQTLGPVNTIVGTSGNDQTGFDFANFELYDISGTKYEDVNGNGAVDAGDNGLAGWTIFIDANNNQTLDAGEKSAVTDANGNWSITGLDASFDGLPVLEVNQAGWVQTLGPVNTIVGTSGNDQTGFDFANFELYDISGTKYNDINGDGQTAGDPGLGGVTIFIDKDNSGDLSAGDDTTTTANDGSWSFTGLDASYAGLKVYEVVPDGQVQTLGQAGYIITGTSGTDQTGLDFANHVAGPGVRTPGFWGNLGLQFWDGQVNETKVGPNFPIGDLLIFGHTDGTVDSNGDGVINQADKGLLIGDYDHDGVTTGTEDTFFISLEDARNLVSGGGGSDGVTKLGRDVVATWLNYLAGNAVGTPGDQYSPHHFLDDAVDWLQTWGGKNGNGNAANLGDNDKTESFDSYDSHHTTVKSNAPQWNTPQFAGDNHSAALLHGELDYYNNHGATYTPGSDPLELHQYATPVI